MAQPQFAAATRRRGDAIVESPITLNAVVVRASELIKAGYRTGGGSGTARRTPLVPEDLAQQSLGCALAGGAAAKLTRRVWATLDGKYLHGRRASTQRRLPQRDDSKIRAEAYAVCTEY